MQTTKFRINNFGFTLIELLLVMGIFAILAGFITINLINPQTKSSLDSTVTTLTADLKQQQNKAMIGSTDSNFGIQFASQNYTLLNDNLVINLDSNISLINDFPSSQAVFNKRSGELVNTGTITVSDSSGNSKIISVNKLGAINIQ